MLVGTEIWVLCLSIVLALVLDCCCGEPKRWHPLVGFGTLADWLESLFNQAYAPPSIQKSLGVIAFICALAPIVWCFLVSSLILNQYLIVNLFMSAVVLYLCIGWRSLTEHALVVKKSMQANDTQAARQAVAMIVSRDTSQLADSEIARAATESLLENGADAIFSALFWFVCLGVPGVVLYRLVNTLDAMWGYKNKRFLHFGWISARMDDVMNYLPARLTAISYALMGNASQAFRCWRKQGKSWKSPNAGVVMAAGAGALGVCLGGAAIYQGKIQDRPRLGMIERNIPLSASIIDQALGLIRRALMLWVLACVGGTLFAIVVLDW